MRHFPDNRENRPYSVAGSLKSACSVLPCVRAPLWTGARERAREEAEWGRDSCNQEHISSTGSNSACPDCNTGNSSEEENSFWLAVKRPVFQV